MIYRYNSYEFKLEFKSIIIKKKTKYFNDTRRWLLNVYPQSIKTFIEKSSSLTESSFKRKQSLCILG